MICEIIFTGTELLLGQILNTNAQVIQRELTTLGIDLYYQVTVGDNLQRCAAAIKQAAGRADLIIVGGGLGPTEDDISREALAEALQLELVQDERALEVVRRFFDRRGLPIGLNNFKQALVPAGGRPIDNPIGTAPGVILEHAGKTYILVPGPPPEFNMMVRKQVMPYLESKLVDQVGVIKSRVLKFCGIGESLLDERLGDLLKSANPSIAPTAKFAEIHLRITAKARQAARAEQMIDAMESRVRERLGSYIFGTNDDTLPGAVTRVLREQGKTIAVAENFTGGQLAYQLSSASDAEHTFAAGLVTREYRLLQEKSCLQPGDIPTGAGERAGYMAHTVRKQFGTDIGAAVAVHRPVGEDYATREYSLYLAADCNGRLMQKKVIWSGGRDEIAKRAATLVLVLLWRYLKHGIPF